MNWQTELDEHGCALMTTPLLTSELAGIPGVLIHGRLDFSSPVEVAWKMAQAWPDAELHVVEAAGHGTGLSDLVLSAVDRFAARLTS